MGLDIIEEGHEDETLKGERGLYRPKPSRNQIGTRESSSVQRKNQKIIQNAAIAKPTPTHNYHSAANAPNSQESRSAQIQSNKAKNLHLYRELYEQNNGLKPTAKHDS